MSSSAGIGLSNVRRRLELCYGAEARFQHPVRAGSRPLPFLFLQSRVVSSQSGHRSYVSRMLLKTLIVDDEPIDFGILLRNNFEATRSFVWQ